MPSSTGTIESGGRRGGTIALGLALLVFAAAALWFARDIGRAGIAGNNDPGPQFFPLVLAAALLLFSLVLIGVGLLARPDHPWLNVETAETPADTDRRPWRWLVLLAMLTVYVVSLDRVGFSLSTWAVAAGLMIWLGNRWWVALFVAAVMVAVVKLLFVILFRVQLPLGQLGVPF